jgi:hypothetical protein
VGNGDLRAFFHSSAALANPSDAALIDTIPISLTASDTTTTFEVPKSAPPGRGLIAVECGGNSNADAYFTVT